MAARLGSITGAGMQTCKQALVDADGNMDTAVDILRKQGAATAATKALKEAREGVIANFIQPGGKLGVWVYRGTPVFLLGPGEADLHQDLSRRVPEALFPLQDPSRAGEKRVVEICERFGTEVYKQACEALLARTERAMRQLIVKNLPTEPRSFEDYIDDDGINLETPLALTATLAAASIAAVLIWTRPTPTTTARTCPATATSSSR